MSTEQHTTPTMIPVLDNVLDRQSKPGVSARRLYDFLQLNTVHWARWTKRNILQNPYAIEHEDWEIGFHPSGENPIEAKASGRPTQDYVLSLDLAKKLAMMTRTDKGEEARQYFLDCERIAQRKSTIPQVRDHRTQVAIETLIRLDEAEHRIAVLEHETREKSAQLEAQQQTQMAETIKAQELALTALRSQQWVSLRQYVAMHELQVKMPESLQAVYGRWLAAYCAEKMLPVYNIQPADRRWDKENTYPMQAIADTLSPWLIRRNGQPLLAMLPTHLDDIEAPC